MADVDRTHWRRTLRWTAVLLVLAPLAPGQSAKTPWRVEDVVRRERFTDVRLEADGSHALWIKHAANDEKDTHVATLVIADLATGESRPLTGGTEGVTTPRFSPGGRWIGFLSSRALPAGTKKLDDAEKGAQLWLLDRRGGEATLAARVPFGVDGFAFVDDRTVYLVTRDAASAAERAARTRKDGSLVVEDTDRWRDAARRLFRLDLDTKALTRLTTNDDHITAFAVAPGGKRVIALHDQSPSHEAEGNAPPRTFLHDLATKSHRELYAGVKSQPVRFVWRPDGAGFYALRPQPTVDGENWAALVVVDAVAADGSTTTPIAIDWPHGLLDASSFSPTRDGFVTGLARGARPAFARYTAGPSGWTRALVEPIDGRNVFALHVARASDRIVVFSGTASIPDHVEAGRLEGASIVARRALARPSGGYATKRIARTEVVRWAGANDETVEGILYYPHDWPSDEATPPAPRPLVLVTHGGPFAASYDRFTERWSNTPNLYAQRGAFVLKVNYHGSSDYGLAFAESIKGRYYELEVVDMLRGIRTLVDAGRVDPARIGLVGWSNGAILSIAAITHGNDYVPDHGFTFRACAPGAGDVNWTSDYGNCRFGASFDEYYIGGAPWQAVDRYIRKSPLFRAPDVTVPTIIFFGTKDSAVPTEQGWQWYRALHRIGNAPVRFVLFPDEPHGLKKLSHQRRKLTEELAWLDRHLFDAPPAADPCPPGSPLDVAERTASFARDGAAFGVRDAGRLVPETVVIGGKRIGRFEVTRAQWRAFRPDYDVPPGTENYPAHGVSAKEAQAYVTWLNAGDATMPWRLPDEGDRKALESAKGATRENTLALWVGHAPRPSEASTLAARVASLGWRRALRPVGTGGPSVAHRGRERILVFDVGGNVAEWTSTPSGLAPRGGCAVRAGDARGESPPPPAFIGLRVARH